MIDETKLSDREKLLVENASKIVSGFIHPMPKEMTDFFHGKKHTVSFSYNNENVEHLTKPDVFYWNMLCYFVLGRTYNSPALLASSEPPTMFLFDMMGEDLGSVVNGEAIGRFMQYRISAKENGMLWIFDRLESSGGQLQ